MDGIIMFYLIGIGIGLFIEYFVAKKFEEIAFGKGYDENEHTFAMCFWLGIIGYLYVIALPDISQKNVTAASSAQSLGAEIHYVCPNCNENVTNKNQSCPRCGQRFDWNK